MACSWLVCVVNVILSDVVNSIFMLATLVCIHSRMIYGWNVAPCSVLARPNLQGGPPFLDLKFDFTCNDPSFLETGKQFVPLVSAV